MPCTAVPATRQKHPVMALQGERCAVLTSYGAVVLTFS